MLHGFCLNIYLDLSCLECHNKKIKDRWPYLTCEKKSVPGAPLNCAVQALNYPTLKIFKGNIHYKGCRMELLHTNLQVPNGMVLSMKSREEVRNLHNNSTFFINTNVHFYLTMSCVKKHNEGLEARHTQVSDDVLQTLTRQHMEVLNQKGFLRYMVRNKTMVSFILFLLHTIHYILHASTGKI